MERVRYNTFFLRDDVAAGIFRTRAPDELDGNPFAMAMRKMHWKSLDHFIHDG
jgi:hypothetical protein